MASHPLASPGLPAPRHPALIPVDDTVSGLARWGWIVVFCFFGLLLGWAALIRLDAAAQGTGAIAVAGSRQVVQHREGGIVKAIHVKDGQRVRAGQVLVELAAGEVVATERSLAAQTIRLQAERARLLAERSGGDVVAPIEFATLPEEDRAEADRAMALQRTEIASRRAALVDQKRVLNQQAAQLEEQIGGLRKRMTLNRGQEQLYNDELSGMQALAAQGYVSKNRVRALEHQRADMSGQTVGLASSAASAREQIGERRMQALTLDSQQSERVSQELRETEAALNDVLPKYRAARQQREATLIRATASGQIVGLSVFTVGGVIAPGQTLMSIVPDAVPLVIEAQFAPDDADDVHVGQRAEVRISALHDRGAPVLYGTITRVSADSFQDEKTGRAYYTATVSVPPAALADLSAREGRENSLKPGLPAQILVPLRPRTMLQYLLEPVDQAMWRSMREH